MMVRTLSRLGVVVALLLLVVAQAAPALAFYVGGVQLPGTTYGPFCENAETTIITPYGAVPNEEALAEFPRVRIDGSWKIEATEDAYGRPAYLVGAPSADALGPENAVFVFPPDVEPVDVAIIGPGPFNSYLPVWHREHGQIGWMTPEDLAAAEAMEPGAVATPETLAPNFDDPSLPVFESPEDEAAWWELWDYWHPGVPYLIVLDSEPFRWFGFEEFAGSGWRWATDLPEARSALCLFEVETATTTTTTTTTTVPVIATTTPVPSATLPVTGPLTDGLLPLAVIALVAGLVLLAIAHFSPKEKAQMTNSENTRFRGFSLLELAVVVGIIGVIAAIAIPVFRGQRSASQDAVAKSSVRHVASSAYAARAVSGVFPDASDLVPDHPDLVLTDAASTGPKVVSVAASVDEITLAALSDSGTCWVLTGPAAGPHHIEGYKLADGEPCGAATVMLQPIVLTAVLIHPDGSVTIEWEPDPAVEEYEICVDSECFTTSTPSFTYGGSGSVSIRSGHGIVWWGGGSGSSGGGSGGGSGGSVPEPPPAPDESEPISVSLLGSTVALSWGSVDGVDEYRVYRCSTAGCTSGSLISFISPNGSSVYSYEDDVAGLIEAGAEVARYQVVAVAGIYQVASNWAEVELPAAPAGAWATISAGGAHTCGLTADGTAYCWGWGSEGQLGNGSTDDYSTPQPVLGGHTWASIAAGISHTCGLTTDGAAYCWGSGSVGQLGNGSTDVYSTPQLVSGGHTWASITAGENHTCGLTTNGTAYCWGYGFDGQLGNGSHGFGVSATTPTLVSGGHTWTSIFAGGNHTCGLTTAGDAYCWGYGLDGQLGNGSTDNAAAPTLVSDGHTWASISAGGAHTCGLTTDGTAYCWGYGFAGQLGNGSTDDYSTPQPVLGGHTWTSIFAGGNHTCGLTTAGDAYCWGSGLDGQLGNGSTDDAAAPTLVSDGHTWATISAGGAHTCGLTTNGTAYCWGYGFDGQLGNGSTADAATPQQVISPWEAA